MNEQIKRIYLDHSATTPVDPAVVETMRPYFTESFGNASSIHVFGREAKIALEESRETIAAAISAKMGELFFTSGGTEADNHAMLGAAFASKRSRGHNHLVISAIEHHAVIHTGSYLRENGFEVTHVPVDEFGMVDPNDVQKAMTPKTSLVSVMHANNEIGTIQHIEDIARVAHERGALLHTDAVQSFGKIPVDVNLLGADLLSLSAHKIYGPKGVGAVYIRKGVDVDSFMHGGAQERNRRAGTENVPLAVGFAKAVSINREEMAEINVRLIELRRLFRQKLADSFDTILFNGHPTESLPTIVNISFDSKKVDIDGEALLLNMDLQGVAVTSGSACSSGSMEPSHVLQAIGRDIKTSRASIRFSMGKHTSGEELERTVEVLKKVAGKSSTVRT